MTIFCHFERSREIFHQNEENHARFRNPPGGHQDVPPGQGVPEVPRGFRDARLRDRAASGDAGPGAADLRREAGLRPEHHEAGAGPVRRDVAGAPRHAGGPGRGQARRGPGPWGHDHLDGRGDGGILPTDSRRPRGGRPADAQYLQPLAGGDEPADHGADLDIRLCADAFEPAEPAGRRS